jgi:hypothetical protein
MSVAIIDEFLLMAMYSIMAGLPTPSMKKGARRAIAAQVAVTT